MPERYYYLGPWVWYPADEFDGAHWGPPRAADGWDIVLGLFDMRPATGEANGFFAASERLPASIRDQYVELGDGTDLREYRTSQAERDAWRLSLKLTTAEMPDSVALLRDVLVKTFEECGDPEHGLRFYPPTATHDGYLEFYLGGHSVLSRRRFLGTADPAWRVVGPHVGNIYRRTRELCLLTPAEGRARGIAVLPDRELYKRWLWEQARIYQVTARDIVPPDLPVEGVLRPSTTITDDFNRADATPISDSAEGWSWTAARSANDYSILSNTAHVLALGGAPWTACRAESDLSSSNHYSQADTRRDISTSVAAGVSVRFQPAAHSCYIGEHTNAAGAQPQISVLAAGTRTLLANGIGAPTNSTWLSTRLEIDGTTLTLDIAGYAQLQTTDTTWGSGTRCGLAARPGSVAGRTISHDNFEASDVAAPPTANIPAMMRHYRALREA